MVANYHYTKNHCEKLHVYEFWNNVLTLKASLDISNISRFFFVNGLRFFKTIDNYATFIGVDHGGYAHIFRYDYHRKVIVRDIEKMVHSQESRTKNLWEYGGWYYYVGSGGKLLRATLVSEI